MDRIQDLAMCNPDEWKMGYRVVEEVGVEIGFLIASRSG